MKRVSLCSSSVLLAATLASALAQEVAPPTPAAPVAQTGTAATAAPAAPVPAPAVIDDPALMELKKETAKLAAERDRLTTENLIAKERLAAELASRRAELERQGIACGILELADRTPAQVEAGLYAAMHELDTGGYERLLCLLPPDLPEWLAVRDRLLRASTPD